MAMTKKDRDKIILINQAYFSHYQSMQVLCISSLIPRPHLCQIQSLAVRLLNQNHLHRLPMWEILVQRKIKSINVPMLCGDCRDLVYTGYITTWLHAATHMHASTAALGQLAKRCMLRPLFCTCTVLILRYGIVVATLCVCRRDMARASFCKLV